jgi:hypothetical protein
MKTSKVFLPLIALFFFIASSVSSFGQVNVPLTLTSELSINSQYDKHFIIDAYKSDGQIYSFEIDVDLLGETYLLGTIPAGNYDKIEVSGFKISNWSSWNTNIEYGIYSLGASPWTEQISGGSMTLRNLAISESESVDIHLAVDYH